MSFGSGSVIQLYAGVVAAGFDDLSAAHVALWRYPGLEGVRPSQLADRVGITKQSVNDLLGHLEGHGYLSRVPDSADGRARVIRLTAKGGQLGETIYAAAGAAQLQIEEILGPRRFAQLHSSLELLAEQVEGDQRPSPNAAGSESPQVARRPRSFAGKAAVRTRRSSSVMPASRAVTLVGERVAQGVR